MQKNKCHTISETSFCSNPSWDWLESSLPGTHFPSPPLFLLSLTDCSTLPLSARLHSSLSPSLSSIVAISCLLCMDFDFSQGAILHLVLSSHTYTCMHAHKGEKKNLPSEDLFIKCAVKSCQAFHVRAHFPAPGYPKEKDSNKNRPQCNLHNFHHCILFMFYK